MTFTILSLIALSSAAVAAGPDPIVAAIDAVPSYRIYQFQQHASQIDGECRRTGAMICRAIHRLSNDPGAGARDVDQAMHGACDAGSGIYDAAADLGAAVTSAALSLPAGKFDAVHTCRIGRRVRAIRVHVDDYGAVVDQQQHNPITRLLGDKRSRYEAVTSVIGYMIGDVVVLTENLDRARAARCHETTYADLREGVMTTAGLLVEIRSTVALVQPDHGPAIWMPVGKLELAGTRPGCPEKPALP